MVIAMKARMVPLLLALLLSTSCTYGFIYTDISEPLVRNMDATPNPKNAKTVSLGQLKLEEPFTPVGLRVEVNSNAIGEAARQHGIEDIYYADLRTISILGGIFQMRSVYVTGLPEGVKGKAARVPDTAALKQAQKNAATITDVKTP